MIDDELREEIERCSKLMFDENGIDLSLIDENLALTPTERVIKLERLVAMIDEFREYGRRSGLHSGTAPAVD